jgi:hypothetical protein
LNYSDDGRLNEAKLKKVLRDTGITVKMTAIIWKFLTQPTPNEPPESDETKFLKFWLTFVGKFEGGKGAIAKRERFWWVLGILNFFLTN